MTPVLFDSHSSHCTRASPKLYGLKSLHVASNLSKFHPMKISVHTVYFALYVRTYVHVYIYCTYVHMYSIYTFVNLRNTHTVHVCVLAHLIPLLLTLFSDCLCGLGAHDQLPQEVSLKRKTFFQECALLLAENGGAVQVKNIQPFYQTRYKKSPRLSDYGSENMRELLKLSPLFKVLIPCLTYVHMCVQRRDALY